MVMIETEVKAQVAQNQKSHMFPNILPIKEEILIELEAMEIQVVLIQMPQVMKDIPNMIQKGKEKRRKRRRRRRKKN